MTKVVRCDKCGKEYRGYFSTTITTHTYIGMLGHMPMPNIDLCDDCTKLLSEWLKQ